MQDGGFSRHEQMFAPAVDGQGSVTVSAMTAIAVVREGKGEEVLLVHGGARPRTTWGALAALSSRWTLAYVHRRSDGVGRAHRGRLPGEARPALEALRDARIPPLVASGDHAPGIERICDTLAAALDGERLVAPGAGHFVAAAPGFAGRLEAFLASADRSRGREPSG